MKRLKSLIGFFTLGLIMVTATSVYAEDSEELAKKLANPVAALISVPLQYNYDSDIGVDDTGSRSTVNIQPVIPISLNDDWNVISRTILPVVWQDDIFTGAGSQSGIGNVLQSFFFSPKLPTENGWIWGVGPVVVLPTATNDLLGGDQWGAGPTAVALKQDRQWTYGALTNHIWSEADDKYQAISNTFIQPFLSYVTEDAVTYTLNSESTYNWRTEQWTVPFNAVISKIMKFGDQLVSVGGGVRYYAESPDNGPEGWGARFVLTFLFPKN